MGMFLNNNPNKTLDEFEAPFIDLSDMVKCSPTHTTCFFDLDASIRKVEKLAFRDQKFVRMVMPLIRDEADKILAWIYASEKELGEYHPKAGDMVKCIIWLCGKINNENDGVSPTRRPL